MVLKYLREQERYTQDNLADILGCSDRQRLVQLLRKLKEYGLFKVVKISDEQKDMSELLEKDIEVTNVEIDENQYFYVFTFVGIIVVADYVLKCYPKYLPSIQAQEEIPDSIKEEWRLVIKVLEKYSKSKEQIIRMFNESTEETSFNLLAVLLYLLRDYYENGIYSNTEEIIEVNGNSEILWDKTVNETFTLIYENRPYYTNLKTRKRINDNYDYFKRLHECVLTIASNKLNDAELLDIFEMSPINLTDEQLDDFGEKEYICYRLERELNVQFNTRKQLVLKILYTYITQSGSLYDTDSISLFGTNSFNLVWEDVCAEIMDNQLERPLGKLNLPQTLHKNYGSKKNLKLKELISNPHWTFAEKDASGTLIPDIITITKINDDWHFIIFDAKYYTPVLDKKHEVRGQPGIESITKQYLYQLAYQPFIRNHGFKIVRNCFLMPTGNHEVELCGEVSLKMLRQLGRQMLEPGEFLQLESSIQKRLELQDIKVRLLPAKRAYDCYLNERLFDIGSLELNRPE